MEYLTVALLDSEGYDLINSKKIVQEIFKQYDLDKNQYLDKKEFVSLMTSDRFISRIFS